MFLHPFSRRPLGLSAVMASLAAAPAFAQAPATAPAGQPVTSVTVAAERPTNRIDRQVYDVKADVGSTNNSAADALNNVPAVTVDPDGTVSLRGSTNVQILVDGKPSAMLQGENRGAALNALPSDDIESIEVINNPGAQFGNEGGGGPILNLVMRRNRRPGGMGSANVNAGTAGRHNASVAGSYNSGLLSFQGGVNFRHDGRDSTSTSERDRINPISGATQHSSQRSSAHGLNDALGINGTLGYNIGQKDRLQASWSYNKRSNDQQGLDHYTTYAAEDGVPSGVQSDVRSDVQSDYRRTSARQGDSINYGWGVQFDHKGEAEGELLKLDFRISSSNNDNASRFANTYAVRPRGALDTLSRQSSVSDNRITDFTGDYELPTDAGLLKLGFKVAQTEGGFDTRYLDIDPASAAERVNPNRTNEFEVVENTIAVYGSWQQRLGERWSVAPGLRIETTDIAIHQITSTIDASNRYTSTIPSLFANYKLDKGNVRLQYAHRIRRPNVNDLNPFVIYRDEFNVSSGNPRLRPTRIDSVEAGWETSLFGLESALRAYLRRESNLISERRYFVSDNVLLTTRDNHGTQRSGGLEFVIGGKLMPGLNVNFNGNFGMHELAVPTSSGEEGRRRTGSLSLKGRVNYQLSAADQMQLAVNRQGKTLSSQGYRKANTTANLSWRHVLTPQLNLVVNVTDLFDSNRNETIVDTDLLRETSVRRAAGRIAYVGLSYRFGGVSGQARGERGGRRDGTGLRRGPGGGEPGGGPGVDSNRIRD
ncbi:MAG: TonB-dependent receptor domain-containing protein [Gammaproteobacteria bacterium]